MTLVRRLAVSISRFVVHHASADSREWAEGLARETEEIPADWAAVGWALGSLRVLLDRREAPICSVAEIPNAAQRLWQSKYLGARNQCIFCFVMAANYALRTLDAKGRVEHLGCSLVIAGALLGGTRCFLDWRRQKTILKEWDLPFGPVMQRPRAEANAQVVGQTEKLEGLLDEGACALYYRSELERLRDASRTPWRLANVVIASLWMTGLVYARRGGVAAHPISTAAVGAFWMLMLAFSGVLGRQQARRYQRQLDELDVVLGAER